VTYPTSPERIAWSAAFGHRQFNLFQGARVLAVLGTQMQGVAIGWQIYAVTGRPIDLAWVGLDQFIPAACLSLVTGQVADRVERRRILAACYAVTAALDLALFAMARGGVTVSLTPIYAVVAGIGVARAFQGPAGQSLLPSLVPAQHFANAVTWSSSGWQTAMVFGPTLGGIAYAAFGGAGPVYAIAAMCLAAAAALVAAMRPLGRPSRGPSNLHFRSSVGGASPADSTLAGVRYVWSNEIVLGAISLDLFAVLLGGATALLPLYARDILHAGPWALGVLRSAPAAGAALTGVALAARPIERGAGRKMLGGVAVFGLATIVFGVSRNLALSITALAVVGAADMVSVVVRSALVQLATPDAMRGRVSAVNTVFIGASNELGEFESGLTAQWLGAVPAVVLGGVGSLLVVAIWASRFPKLRGVNRLRDAAAEG
jgi:MFS family permease